MAKAKRAIVIGAGIVGVTTAEMLLRRGYEVQVFDAADRPAAGASHANAGQLCFPFALALGGPRFLRGLPGNLLDPRSGVSLSVPEALARLPWLVRFMGQCRGGAAAENSRQLLRLAVESQEAFARLQERHAIAFDHRPAAKLWLAPDAETLAAAAAGLPLRREAGFTVEVLDATACRSIVPHLEPRFPLAGAIHAPDSPVGDCRAFTEGLCRALAAAGVAFRFATPVERVAIEAGQVRGVWAGGAVHPAETVVVAAGNATARLLRGVAPSPPIAPLSGYSITLPIASGAPDASLTDPRRAVAICRMGDRLRITGGARFGGVGPVPRREIRRLVEVARGWLPDAADYTVADDPAACAAWCGARPTTPTSRPVIGPAGPGGLYVNAGHGSLGWTLSAGSAERLGTLLP